jgi:peptidase C39-like protein
MPIAAPRIPIPTATEEVPETLARALQAPQLAIQRKPQLEDAWCYAACAVMVIEHVTGQFVQQCEVAGFAKGNINCCPFNSPNICTDSGCRKDQIEPIFLKFNVDPIEVVTEIPLPAVGTEIQANRPIEVVIDWNDNQGSHSVLVTGVREAEEMVFVVDPLTGINNNSGWMTHDSLSEGFGFGSWDRTFRRLRIKV